MVQTLGLTINGNTEPVFEAINGKLEFETNIKGIIKDLEVTLDSNGIPKSTTAFTASSSDRIIGCQVVKAENITNSSTYPSGCPFISYTQIDDKITIKHITGLQADNKYRIRIIAVG